MRKSAITVTLLLVAIIAFAQKRSGVVARSESAKTIPYKESFSIKIKLSKTRILNVSELMVEMILTNTGKHTITFPFDKFNGKTLYPLGTTCNITDAHDVSVLQYNNMAVLDTAKYKGLALQAYNYTMEADEWVMKSYHVTDMVRFDSRYCSKDGKLRPGTYHMQVIFHGFPSNVIEFTML